MLCMCQPQRSHASLIFPSQCRTSKAYVGQQQPVLREPHGRLPDHLHPHWIHHGPHVGSPPSRSKGARSVVSRMCAARLRPWCFSASHGHSSTSPWSVKPIRAPETSSFPRTITLASNSYTFHHRRQSQVERYGARSKHRRAHQRGRSSFITRHKGCGRIRTEGTRAGDDQVETAHLGTGASPSPCTLPRDPVCVAPHH